MQRNKGTDFLTGNLFTDGDPNASVPASVLGSNWLNILQEEIAGAIEAASLVVDQSHDYAANDKTQLTQAIRLLGGAGGGGGFIWDVTDGIAPIEDREFGAVIYRFEQAQAGIATQKLQAYLNVPAGYTAGKQIFLRVKNYSPNSSGTILLSAQATLIRQGVTNMDSVTNQRTSVNVALTNSLANMLRMQSIDITDSTGKINGVAVAASDIIKVELYRGSDTDAGDLRVVPFVTEPKFT